MNIPGYSTLSEKEKDILHAFLKNQGLNVDPKSIVEPKAGAALGAAALGINWCKIICAIKAATKIVACGGNPICIAEAVADGIACAAACK